MWYCFKRRHPYDPPFGLEVGRWYEDMRLPEIEGTIETAYLSVDGEEVSVSLRDLILRETKADYSYAYHVGHMGTLEHGQPISFEMPYAPICPEGHQGTAQTSYPTQHECSECGTTYPVQTKDSGLVLER